MAIIDTPQPHEPWNKGKLIGKMAPLKLKGIWPSASVYNLATSCVISLCSISRSIPSSAIATW